MTNEFELNPRVRLALDSLIRFFERYGQVPDIVAESALAIVKSEKPEQILMFFNEIDGRCPRLLALFYAYRIESSSDDLEDDVEEGGCEPAPSPTAAGHAPALETPVYFG